MNMEEKDIVKVGRSDPQPPNLGDTHPIKVGCDRGLCHQAVGRQDRQLNTYDWLTCLAIWKQPTWWKCSSSIPARDITIM